MPTNWARMISIATAALNTTWPSRIVGLPRAGKSEKCVRAWPKKIIKATAMTISGTTRTRYTTASNGARTRGFIRASASAASRPSAVEMIAASAAICRLVRIAGMNVGSCSPALNQQPVNPFQTVMLPIWSGGMLHGATPGCEAIEVADGMSNAKITMTRIGRYRNANTAIAHAVKPSLADGRHRRRRRGTGRTAAAAGALGTELLLFGGEQDVQNHEHGQRDHQRDGQRRAERLVLRRDELVADRVPDELVLPAGQDGRDDVLPGHRDEHEQPAGDHAGQRQPQGDLPERGQRAGAQVGRGLDQRPVHPLQRGEHRQDEQD